MPWIWDSMNDEDRKVHGTVEMCEVDYSQKVRSQRWSRGQGAGRTADAGLHGLVSRE